MATISPKFHERLDHLPKGKTSRAILMIGPVLQPSTGHRPTREERSAWSQRSNDLTREVHDEIDAVLAAHGGRRLPSRLGSIGGVIVDATPNAIRALAGIDRVVSIVEDQDVMPPSASSR